MRDLRFDLLPPGEKVLLAVSGGRDSVGLMKILLAQKNISALAVAHVNHRMRPDSSRDLFFVEKLSQDLGLEFYADTLAEVPANETEARDRRYEVLESLARQAGASRVVTAHHREDQLETRLLNLLRGSGPRGMMGMSFERELGQGVRLVRPALECSRTKLHEGVTEWVEDASNALPDNPRNFLRLKVIPELAKVMARDPHEAFESLAKILDEDELALQALVPESQVLSRQTFLSLARSLQRRWLRRFGNFSLDELDRSIAAVAEGKSLDLSLGKKLFVLNETVFIESQSKNFSGSMDNLQADACRSGRTGRF